MADLLIKGMEMPTECLECPLKDCDNAWDFGYTRPEDCPLVEVKPHGRLIDADALPIKDEWTLVGTNVIWDAPTVLEASNGKVSD